MGKKGVRTVSFDYQSSDHLWGYRRKKIVESKAKEEFRRLVGNIITMTRVCKLFRQGLRGFREYQIMQTTNKATPVFSAWDKKKQTRMTFTYSDFSTEQGHLPQRVIQITQKKPEWREESEVFDLCNLLQVLESFWNYSRQLQLLLSRVVRYERFGRRRVILKKGHKGNSFYFIYLGTVAVTSDEDGSSAFLDAHPDLLHKGASFGEIALLSGRERAATVVCMEDTELLVVDKEDFFANKLYEEVQKEFRYRYDFFREHDLFKSWSDEMLSRMASHSKVEKYPFGQLITRDVPDSGFVMFVTEGLCDVIRLLDLSTCSDYYKWIWQQLTPHDHNLLDARKHESSARKRYKDFLIKSYPVQDFSNLKMAHLKKIKQEAKPDVPKEDQESSTAPKSLESHNKCFRIGSISCPMVMTEFGPLPKDAVVGVYVKVHSLESGDILGLHQHFIPDVIQDKRSLIMVSQGATVICLRKELLDDLMDAETRGKVKEYVIPYPSDNTMCQKILKENSWNIFRKDLMKLLIKSPTYELFTAFRTHKKGLYSPLSGTLDLKSIGKEPQVSYPIFNAKVDTATKKTLPPLRVVESISAPRYRLKELLPKHSNPGILLQS